MATIILRKTGVITLDGLINGVDFAALRGNVVSHHASHAMKAGSRSADTTDTISLQHSYRCASDNTGTNDGYRAWSMNRTHSHALSFTVATTFANTTIVPAGAFVILDKANGHIDCYTIDGYCPAEIYARYRNHTHGFAAGNILTNETLGPYSPGGSYPWFYTQLGGVWAWRKVKTTPGTHNHSVNTLALQAVDVGDAPAPPIGTVGAGSPRIKLAKAGGHITMKGRVNTIGISAFYSYYINHEQHRTTGVSSDAGATSSELFDDATGNTINMEWSGGSGRGYIVASVHNHGISGYVVGSP